MSKTARTFLGVLAALGVAGATLGLLVYLNQPAESSAPAPGQPPPPPPPAAEPPAVEADPEPVAGDGLDELPAEDLLALKRLKHKRRRRGNATRVAKPVPETEPVPPADTQPPPLRVLTPRGHAVVMTPKLLLRVKSEPGAQVAVNQKPLAEHSKGLFALNLRLNKGRNRLTVTARDEAGNQRQAVVTATFIDPQRFQKNKAGFVHLLEQLDEVRASAAELDRRISQIVAKLDDPAHADKVSLLSLELREIRATRGQIEEEVGKAIQEIDTLLAESQ